MQHAAREALQSLERRRDQRSLRACPGRRRHTKNGHIQVPFFVSFLSTQAQKQQNQADRPSSEDVTVTPMSFTDMLQDQAGRSGYLETCQLKKDVFRMCRSMAWAWHTMLEPRVKQFQFRVRKPRFGCRGSAARNVCLKDFAIQALLPWHVRSLAAFLVWLDEVISSD